MTIQSSLSLLLFLILLTSCGQSLSELKDFKKVKVDDPNDTSISLSGQDFFDEGEGEGDCDDSSECKIGLSCVNKKTLKIESFNNKIPGHETCEKVANLFGIGEGDCDDSSECRAGLVCLNKNENLIESFDNKVDGSETCEENPGANGGGQARTSRSGLQVHPIATSTAYACGDRQGRGLLELEIPKEAEKGDLLALFLHRTDGPLYEDQNSIEKGGLPLSNGSVDASWKKEAACYMRENGKPCTEKWSHQDLVQTLLWKIYDGGNRTYKINMPAHKKSKPHKAPQWATLVVLKNADPVSPIFSSATRSPDGTDHSVFPKVKIINNGYLLLSQSFDDATSRSKFQAPVGTSSLAFATGSRSKYGCDNDETGFLFGKMTNSTNNGREYTTKGSGASEDKDIMISISIRPK